MFQSRCFGKDIQDGQTQHHWKWRIQTEMNGYLVPKCTINHNRRWNWFPHGTKKGFGRKPPRKEQNQGSSKLGLRSTPSLWELIIN